MIQQGVTISRKIPHGVDISGELAKAARVARFAIDNPDRLSTKHVRDIGLNAAFADMILRHYGWSPPKTFREEKVKLIIAGSKTPVDLIRKTIYIRPLRLMLPCAFPSDFVKVRRVMLDKEYVYVDMLVQSQPLIDAEEFLGVDLNISTIFAVVWVPSLHKYFEYGNDYYAHFIKYRRLKDELGNKKKYEMLYRIRSDTRTF